MRYPKLKIYGVSVLLLGLLANPGINALADTFVRDDILTNPSPEAFSVCYGYTCTEVVQLVMPPTRWHEIQAIFHPGADNPAKERWLIAKAIAHMEEIVGPMTDTANDKGRNLQGLLAKGNQMDCIDESTNTTTYLSMMQRAGLLRWHKVMDRSTRGFFIFDWPHTTAVIKEIDSSMEYAVDSWFQDNGVKPDIVELAAWREGWEPEEQSE